MGETQLALSAIQFYEGEQPVMLRSPYYLNELCFNDLLDKINDAILRGGASVGGDRGCMHVKATRINHALVVTHGTRLLTETHGCPVSMHLYEHQPEAMNGVILVSNIAPLPTSDGVITVWDISDNPFVLCLSEIKRITPL